MSEAEFIAWTESEQAHKRYPELWGVNYTVVVAHRELNAFASQVKATTPSLLSRPGAFAIAPAGNRPYYCLARLEQIWPSTAAAASLTVGWKANRPPALIDDCALPGMRAGLFEARDSGSQADTAVRYYRDTLLFIQAPVYRGGRVPRTPAARRQKFSGISIVAVLPDVILNRALSGTRNLALTLRYIHGGSDVTFSAGPQTPGSPKIRLGLGDGWTTTVSGEVAAAAISADDWAVALLAGGICVSVLLATLVYTLASGRLRAWNLVAQRTQELGRQALHDPLTDLPNRALVFDRLDQLVRQSRRDGAGVAVLYIDLDGFKQVNDTNGHEAGDEVLREVAERLKLYVREADTIARLGGDEFVVLLSGSEPEAVARRIIDALGQPYEVARARTDEEAGTYTAMVTASVGIAVAQRPDGASLLRDADAALYEAKARGKNCFVCFPILG